eukprot:534431-Pelagomonas_calceolata.AAC.10
MQQRTRVTGIWGLLFTAVLPHDAARRLLFTPSFGTWLPGLLPYALPEGIGKAALSSARFTRLRKVDAISRPLDTYSSTILG